MESGVSTARDGDVAVITLCRPKLLNAFDLPAAVAVADAVEAAGSDGGVRAILLRAEGKHFCAGGDLAAMRASSDPGSYVRELAGAAARGLLAMRGAPKPVVAELKGAVAGGGVGLALGADVRIAEPDTRFSLAFLRVGLTPDTGTTWLLPRLVGGARTMELAFMPDPVRAEEAKRLGLINRIVPADELEAKAMAWARELAALPPLAVAELKALVDSAHTTPLAKHVEKDTQAVARTAASADFQEGLGAFFEKRPPRFQGK